MVLSKENSTLFSLLRHALWQNRDGEQIDFDLTTLEWQRLIENAASMGVLAVAFDALPKGEALPGLTKELMIRWGLSVQRFEDRNRRQRVALRELIAYFRENQIEVLLLKGLGLAENYPFPAHRECGDLDIYLFGDYEKGNQVIEALGIEVDKEGTKHSHFFFKGIPVENHLSFLDVGSSQSNKKLEVHLHRILKEQGYETIMIDDIAVRIPTPDFTSLFLTRHNITHFLSSGLVLRHFCDMALFFSRNADRINFTSFRKIITEEKQFNLFSSFTQLAHLYLGMPDIPLPVPDGCETLTERVLYDTLNNEFRKINMEELLKWWVPKRKLFSAIILFHSKWKYDLIDKWGFYHRLVLSFKALL
jgi:hypothetical protein